LSPSPQILSDALKGRGAHEDEVSGILAERGQKRTRLRVPLCKQTTDFSCGACATLMVWRYFDRKVELSKQNEFLIWMEIVALPFKFSSPYRIATFFVRRGLETRLLMGQEAGSEGKTLLECCQVDPTERRLFLDFFKAYNEILKSHIASAILDREPTLRDIKIALFNDSPVIALVDSYYTAKTRGARDPPHLPHWVVVTGYEDDKFHLNDPMYETGLKSGKMVMDSGVLEKAMATYPRFGWPSALIVAWKAGGSIPFPHDPRK